MSEDLILQTKLQPPQIRGRILRRERLLNLLKENLDKKLILICADAGYGKTTLLTQFCAEIDRPFLFYDLDTSDNDIAAFFNYLVSGIQWHYRDFGQRTRSTIPQTRNIEILVGTFINEFAEKIKEEYYIILDDYHHLQQNREIGNALDYLLRHLPSNLHLVISSRSSPPLNLAYYFVKQELFRVEKKRLQFTLKETQLLLKIVYGLNIPDEELERVEKHSEGWITAIQLILQKIYASGEDKAKETLNGYVASGEEVFNYFATEIFKNQTKKIQEFLMKTSILNEMYNEVCNYLLRIRDARKVLKYLETEHIFITRSDNSIYKYHPLFKEFLGKELKQQFTSKQISTLHNRMAMFFEKKNLIEFAITHYLYTQKFQSVIKLVFENIKNYMNAGRIGIVENWLSSIPEKYYDKYPQLNIYRGHLFRLKGLWTEARQMLNQAKGILKTKRSKTSLAEVWFEFSTISSMQGDMIRAHKELMQAKRVCKRLNPDLKLVIANCMAIITHSQKKYKESEKHLLAGIEECRKYKKYDKLSGLICNLGVLYSERGNFNKAEDCYKRAIELIEKDFFWLDMPLAYENLAGISIIKGEYEEARRLLMKGIELSEKYENKHSLSCNYLRFGELHQNLQKYQEALEYFNKATDIAADLKIRGILIETQCAIGSLFSKKGDVKTAEEYLRSSQRLAGKNAGDLHIDLLNSEIEFAKKNYRSAERTLRRVLLHAQKNRLNYMTCKCHLMLAKIYEHTNANKKLIKSLNEAIYLSQQWGYEFFLRKELTESLAKTAQKSGLQIYPSRTFGKIKKPVVSAHINISFFGKFVVSYDDKPIENRYFTNKAKKLFCYFVLHRGQNSTRERLVQQLWPDCDVSKGANRFYLTLNYIRKALATRKHEAYHRDIILYREKSYILSPDITIDSDIAEFEEVISQGKIAFSTDETAKASVLLKKASDIYGAPLCEDWYDNWIEEKRQVYENMHLKALALLTEIDFRNRLYEECVVYSQKYLMIDKFNEEINRKLILSLLHLGELQKAANQYENLRKIFEELNIKPADETIALYKQLHILPS